MVQISNLPLPHSDICLLVLPIYALMNCSVLIRWMGQCDIYGVSGRGVCLSMFL